MVKIMDIPNSRGRDSFWEAYLACAEENRVRPDRSPFYVNWARDFANFLPEKPLKERSRKDIEGFLADLGESRGNGAGTVGTCQCRHHHDLHPRTEQARALGGIKPRCSWDDGTLSKKDKGVKIFKYLFGTSRDWP